MENTRQRKKKKKLRKGRIFFLLILIALIAGAGYVYTEYKSGIKMAEADAPAKPTLKFDGDPQSNKDIENILLVGVDSRGEKQSRSDTMMLVSWNKDTNDIKMVSFMRDIFADIPGYKQYKLNTAYYLDGADLLKATLKNMFDVEINHVAVVDFNNFEKIVDVAAPNGVEVTVPHDMSKNIGVHLKKGTQKLNGKELLGFSRFRYDAEGDFGRVKRQQQALEALKKEVIKPSNVKNYPKLLGTLQGSVQSDINKDDQLKMLLGAVKGGGVSIEKLTIPVENSYSFIRDPESGSVIQIDLEKNLKALNDFLVFEK
ncbi:LytR family transcriptional regulator [Kurthia zopfii]|uniref:Regulatory protein MsrR n=1 Tax=Kurthia zopfii TaxID=1650 RepID=A0A8B4QA33_9BACL|nr:LCP family protein [Kurthia zopfii]PWI22586.1 transcriptional regulator [Kurthia zopfii]TDR39044.1 LytR family transcriptional attenuator [Kurthia zopfii]GEK31267.1 LytR family transcriptional regulator [Kurthia zopfii]STX09580.1 Regulatory protein msrR [Kurthia zopfii]